jgi:high-affinity nickel-transport protein
LLYRPWRRRVDKMRLGNAHFEPVSQDSNYPGPSNQEQQQQEQSVESSAAKDVNVVVQSIEDTSLAGRAHR